MKKFLYFCGFLFQIGYVVMLILSLIKLGEKEDPEFLDYAFVVVSIALVIPTVCCFAINNLIHFIIYSINDGRKELKEIEEKEIADQKAHEEFLKKYNYLEEKNGKRN